MLYGYKKLDKYLSDWCKTNGFKVSCQFSTDFEYDSDLGILYYSIVVPKKHDELFYQICKKYLPSLTKCDNFILSFFHELGHYVTEDDYTDDEWTDYTKFINEFKNSKLTLQDYKRYYKYPIELNATKWGCQYIEHHLDQIKEFSDITSNLIKQFYKRNNIEIT